MNTLLKLLPTLALAVTALLAQAQTSPVAQEEGHLPKKGKKMEARGPMKDGVLMKDGKMMQMKDGQTMALASEITMNNGTKVMPDGTVTMAGGKTMMLKNGQYVLMDGSVVSGKMMHSKPKKDKMSM